MKTLSFHDFNTVYQDSVNAVFNYWTPRMQEEIARHCYGWNRDLFDFKTYLQASSIRFYRAYRSFAEDKNNKSVCDVGGFWGVFLITLKKLGYNVTMTESLQYYSGAFNDLFKFISDCGVNVVNYDPFEPRSALQTKFDIITVMAVLEHYPHSPKFFMENMISMMKPQGKLYIEVPNIVQYSKRIPFILGTTPLIPVQDIYKSRVPFIGHHHEYTIAELRALADLSGLVIISEYFYNYSPGSHLSLKMLLRNPIQFFAFLFLKDSRECLSILCGLKG